VRLSELVDGSGGGLLLVEPGSTDPEVTSVVTTDLLDPRRYLVGGELVLSGLAWWRPHRPARTRSFVAALVEAGVAGLAAGEAQLDGVPQDLVTVCAALGLPLLRVPVAVSFATVMERAGRRLSPSRPDDLAALLGRHRALLAAATGAAADPALLARGAAGAPGLTAVLEWVGADLDLRCGVFSAAGRLIGATGPAPGEEERRRIARRFLHAPSLPHRLPRPGGRTVTLFGAGGPALVRIGSWIVAIDGDDREWTGGRREAVEELVSLIALERDLAGRRSDMERQLAAALSGGTAGDAVAAMSRCGIDPGVASVTVLGTGRHAGTVLAEAFAAEAVPTALGESGREWLGVVATAEPGDLVTRLRRVVAALEPGLGEEPLRIGVSDAVTGGDGVLGAVAEARSAAVAGHATQRHSVGGPDLLASHALLLAAVPAALRQAYRSRVLGPLLEHDRAHRTELLPTLAAYLECSGSWSRCAARMHVHVNTLRYRIERIEALTGRDLRRLEDQMDLLLALRLPA
jgi:hypothetical protein